MSFFQLALIFLTIAGLSVGQILFKLAAMELQPWKEPILRNMLNSKLLIALLVYGLATILWLAVLRMTPLRIAYPFVAMAFILVPLMSHYWLDEPLRITTFVGAAFIIIGVIISIWGTE